MANAPANEEPTLPEPSVLHREALKCALQLGIIDIYSARELNAEMVFTYLVPSDYHKLIAILKQGAKISNIGPPVGGTYLSSLRVADYRDYIEFHQQSLSSCIPIQRFSH